MSIDYDRLRADLAGTEAGTPGVVHCTWTDLARELLRLHDGVEQAREFCLLERDAAFQETGEHAGVPSAYNNCADALTDLLNGDTE